MVIEDQFITDKSLPYLDKIKLNIGCGNSKLEGFVNIDSWPEGKPDLVLDITKSTLPYQNDVVDEIVFFHCIEHIPEKFHDNILSEFFRVLKTNGFAIISYPEFLKCADAYRENLRGQRDFFKMTIYGRQAHEGDFHISLMDTPFFLNRLRRLGFIVDKVTPEPEPNEFNTVIKVTKGIPFTDREKLLREEIFNR